MIREPDNVNHPAHYTSPIPDIECIDVAKNLDFCTGNAIKYIWRHQFKGEPIEDLNKAIWYLRKRVKMYEDQKSSGEKV